MYDRRTTSLGCCRLSTCELNHTKPKLKTHYSPGIEGYGEYKQKSYRLIPFIYLVYLST